MQILVVAVAVAIVFLRYLFAFLSVSSLLLLTSEIGKRQRKILCLSVSLSVVDQ